MTQLAISCQSVIEWVHARIVASRPLHGPADPANDKLDADALRNDLRRAQSECGMAYQPAASKMWWLR